MRLADGLWARRHLARQDLFNFRNSVCQHVGFVVRGLFRVYYVAPATAQEHNTFFVPEGTFLTSLKSLLTQEACPYDIAALEDAELLVIGVGQLRGLYAASHGWERFGRLLAEQYLILHQGRAESLLFQTAEQRYLALLAQFPGVTNRVSLGHIASYLGIQGPSLSRIRVRLGKGSRAGLAPAGGVGSRLVPELRQAKKTVMQRILRLKQRRSLSLGEVINGKQRLSYSPPPDASSLL